MKLQKKEMTLTELKKSYVRMSKINYKHFIKYNKFTKLKQENSFVRIPKKGKILIDQTRS